MTTLTPGEEIQLEPYHTETATPSITPTPEGLPTITPKPTLTPTPRTYEIRENDTLLAIAYYYGITLEELQQANPDVNPALLSIGSLLIIPPGQQPTGTPLASTPTPFGVTIGEVNCFSGRSGGLHCYVLVSNDRKNPAEYLSASLALVNQEDEVLLSKVVPLALKKLMPGTRIPFYAYFSPPLPEYAAVDFQLLTAVKSTAENENTQALVMEDLAFIISVDGSSAEISGVARTTSESAELSGITLVAVAYDAADRVVGMRRIDQRVEQASSLTFPFNFRVYSDTGKIVKVEVFGEAE